MCYTLHSFFLFSPTRPKGLFPFAFNFILPALQRYQRSVQVLQVVLPITYYPSGPPQKKFKKHHDEHQHKKKCVEKEKSSSLSSPRETRVHDDDEVQNPPGAVARKGKSNISMRSSRTTTIRRQGSWHDAPHAHAKSHKTNSVRQTHRTPPVPWSPSPSKTGSRPLRGLQPSLRAPGLVRHR